MKQQLNSGIKDDELQYMKHRRHANHEPIADKSVVVPKKQFQNSNQFNIEYGRDSDNQCNESLILETQAALKSLSGSWSETNTSHRTNNTDDSSVYRNLFEEKTGSKRMSPTITTSAFNANDSSLSQRGEYYYSNGKPKLGSQSKKPRLIDDKYQSHDFNELVVGGDSTNQTEKLTLQSDKSESVYENTSEYPSHRVIQSFSQNVSAFHPPLFDTKKSNSFGSMSHSAYNYTDSSGYSTYSSLDVNASSNSSPERERPFGKTFTKDDDMNAADYKEYTTLQPAGVGSKAASVIQDVSREGVASVVVMNSMNSSNTGASNTSSTVTVAAAAAAVSAASTASSNERAFFERPMAAFSPGSTNKGKLFQTK